MAGSDTRVGVEIQADASSVAPAFNTVADKVNNLEKPLESLNLTMKAVGATFKTSFEQIASTAPVAGQQIDKLKDKVDTLKKKIGEPSAAQKFQADMNLMRQGMDIFTQGMSGTSAALIGIQQGPQVLDGLIMRTGSLGGAMRLLFSPAVLATGALAGLGAAAAYVAIQMHEGREEQIAFNNSLLLTGGYAGQTSGQLLQMGDTIASEFGVSASAAHNLTLALVQTGRASASEIKSMTTGTLLYAKAMNIDASDALKKFTPLLGDTTSAAINLNEQMHLLTAEQLQQIQTLERNGQQAEAVKIVMDAVTNAAAQQSQNLGILESAWRGIGIAIDGAVNAMKSWGRQKIVDQTDPAYANSEVTRLQNEKKLKQDQLRRESSGLGKFGAMGDYGAGYDAHIQGLKTEIDTLDSMISGYKELAQTLEKAKASDAQTEENKRKAADAMQIVLRNQSTITKLKAEEATLTEAIRAGTGDIAAFEKAREEVRRKIKSAEDKAAGIKKVSGPTVVQTWEQELQQQLIASNNYFDDQTEAELKFWKAKQSQVAEGSRNWLQIQAKIYNLSKQLAQGAYQDQIAADKTRIAAAADSWAEQEAAWDKYLADVAAKYAKDTREYQNALREKENATRQHLQELAQIQAQAISSGASGAAEGVRDTASIKQEGVNLRREAARGKGANSDAAAERQAAQERYQIERESADQIYQIQMDAINRQLELQDLPVRQKRQLEAQKAQIEQQYRRQSQSLEAQHQQRMAQIALQNLNTTRQRYHGYIDGIVQSWGAGVKGMIAGTMSWGDAVRNIGMSMLDTAIGVVERIVQNWIVGELTKRQASTVTAAIQAATQGTQVATSVGTSALIAIADINNSAARAGAAAFASTAAIPVVGPSLAPAAAAAADAATLGFIGQVAASARGGYDIPAGVNPIVQTHAEEMILPAYISKPLRSMISQGGNGMNGGGGGGSSGGDNITIHQQPGESVDALVSRLMMAKKQNKLGGLFK